MRKLNDLLLYARIGVRNILKYKRRSLQVALIVAVGALVMTYIGGFTAGFYQKYLDELLESTSHAKLFRAGYYEKQEISPLELSIENYAAVAEEIRSVEPAAVVSPSISAGVIVSKDDESLTMFCQGIEPFFGEQSDRVFPSYKAYRDRIVSGRFFSSNDEPGILIGTSAAANLSCAVGQSLILFTSDRYGSFNAVELPVIGIYRTGNKDKDEDTCLVTLPQAQRLTGLEGRATEISLLFPSIEYADTFKSRIAGVIERHGLEYFTWKDLMGSMMAAIDLGNKFSLVIYVIFLIVAGVGIMNTVLLSVFDRIRDIGTLRAIGYTKNDVTAMIEVENLLLGAAGALLGTLAGGAILYYFSVYGLGISEATREFISFGLEERIYPLFRWRYLVMPFLASLAIPVIAALYPLFLVRKMKIKEALGYL